MVNRYFPELFSSNQDLEEEKLLATLRDSHFEDESGKTIPNKDD